MTLNSLKMRNKLALVVVLLALPLVLMSWLFIQQSRKDIDFANKEIGGELYLRGAWPVLRGIAGAWVDPSAASGGNAPRLAALGASYDDSFDIGAAGRDLRDIVARLGWPPKGALTDAQTEPAVAAARVLIGKIADGSNLTLDPDLDSFYVMDAATTKLPEAVDKVAALVALARAQKAKSSLSDDDKAAPMVLIGLIKAAADGAVASLDSAARANGEVRRNLEAPAKTFARAAERFSTETMADIVALRDDGKRGAVDLTGLTARASETVAAADALWRASADQLDTLLRNRVDGFRSRLATMLVISAVIVATALVVVWLIVRAITKPLADVQDAMQALARGDLDVVLPAKGRRDEIGRMSDTLYELKDGLREARRLQGEQRAQEARTAEERAAARERELDRQRAAENKAAAERKAAMHKLAGDFERAVGGIIDGVSSAATELEAAARTLTRTADTTQQLSTTLASVSEESSSNVQSVASATEEMTGSVGEISRQVQESSAIAREAVTQAKKTDVRIGELSHAASRIGDVVKLITAIAEQTNLLALNATIEAARAGEAGKGFAVVAQEVKALAAQTAKATGEIGTQIAGMQTATQDSVAAIKEIGGTIDRVSQISASIAAAIEEQDAAIREIARNVQEAAKGSAQVAENIATVDRGAGETGSASAQVLASARSLASESNHLKAEVQKFLQTVRAA